MSTRELGADNNKSVDAPRALENFYSRPYYHDSLDTKLYLEQVVAKVRDFVVGDVESFDAWWQRWNHLKLVVLEVEALESPQISEAITSQIC